MPEATRKALSVIVEVYLAITLLALLARDSWLVWIATMPLIGGLQNHLLLLHHDGAHGLIHPRRKVNDLVTNLFCGYPFFESLEAYREFHFSHHRHVADGERDPEIPYYRAQGYHFQPFTRGEKLRAALLDLCGFHWIQFLILFLQDFRPATPRDRLSLGIFLGIVGTLLAAGGGKMLLWSWILPQITVTFHFTKLRGYREHGARTGGPLESFTQDYQAGIFRRFFLCPLHANFHFTHHRKPGLPWFELPKAAGKGKGLLLRR